MSETYVNKLHQFMVPVERVGGIISLRTVGRDIATLLEKNTRAVNRADFKQSLKYSDVLLKIVWEKLNTGHWKDVDIQWRYAYSLASLNKTLALALQGKTAQDFQGALVSCDMGLLMGAPICDNCLPTLASLLHTRINDMERSAGPKASKKPKKEVILRHADLSSSEEAKLPLRADLSLIGFQTEFLIPRKPVVISGAIEHWPARSKWSVEYVLEVAGHRTVPVEIGSKYTELEWSQKIMQIRDFVDTYFYSEREAPGYLAQHQLFDQILELKGDIMIPDFCFLSESDEGSVDINAWFGPHDTVSPLHQDPRDNLLVQVFGSKYVRLYDVAETENVYPYEDGMMSNTSQVDVEHPDEKKFPRFKAAKFQECILTPGDMLYIPKKWWHFLKSLENSFSVSFWFGE